jgi:hypothetical protein
MLKIEPKAPGMGAHAPHLSSNPSPLNYPFLMASSTPKFTSQVKKFQVINVLPNQIVCYFVSSHNGHTRYIWLDI